MTDGHGRLEFDKDRLADFLNVLELMAAGETQKRLTISPRHDELDAIAPGINVLVGELAWATEPWSKRRPSGPSRSREEALEAGCDACLAKPFKLAELSAAIGRASRSGR
jgi:CheY-like chemotaxis protein